MTGISNNLVIYGHHMNDGSMFADLCKYTDADFCKEHPTIVLARGKGNPEWNYSAPHGAGRLMSRTKARETLDLEAYRKTMEGIYTTSVNEATIDEAPMAYKSLKDIIDVIRESVDVIEILKPIYNFKASE